MKKHLSSIIFCLVVLSANATDSTYLKYKGTYLFPYGSMVQSVDISISDSVLMINSSLGTSRLDKMAHDTFYLVAYDGVVIFKRDSTKTKVLGIKIEAQSVLLEGEKEEDKKSGAKLGFKKEYLVFTNKNQFIPI